ncbi:N-acetylmuramoyl-L-alanine amidase [bacterium]|nr:N-acetylmuramoyl-L-alanine amidase [bacterium]
MENSHDPIVIIDPGHGGIDPGAVSAWGFPESALNMAVAKLLVQSLSDLGTKAVLTRYSDRELAPERRCAIANHIYAKRRRSALFLSVHCNTSENLQANGFEVWTSPGITGADRFATTIYHSVANSFQSSLAMRQCYLDGDPDKEAEYHVLIGTTMPAVLVELAFLSNREDLRRLLNPVFQKAMADALARGIQAGFIGSEEDL